MQEQTANAQAAARKQGKWKAFFKRNYALFVAPVIALLLYCLSLALNGVYPFGTDYTAASYDLSAQICPFIEHIYDVLDGTSTPTYSYAIVGGADVLGTFLYFFISPFSFLFLIFGEGRVMFASSVVTACKLAAIALSGTWFAKKLFNGIPAYLCITVGVVYAFSGYTFVASTYINWVDFLIYMPFCVGAFRRFVRTNQFLLFSLLMACCIYTCFSIACFSMFIVFPVLIAYGLLCVEKSRRNTFIAYLCLSFFLAVAISLSVLLPALAAYLSGGRGGGLFENLWYGYQTTVGGMPQDFDASSFLEDWSGSLYSKWSYILADSLFVSLTLVWFVRKGLKARFSKFMLIAGVLTLLPTVVDEGMLLMNMGSYMSYSLRFGFLSALYFLGGACLCLENLCYKRACAYDGSPLYERKKLPTETESKFPVESAAEMSAEIQNDPPRYTLNEKKSRKKTKKRSSFKAYCVWGGIAILITALAAGFLVWFVSNGNYRAFLATIAQDSAFADTLKNFSSRFAHSLGGLEVVAVLFAVVAIVTVVGWYLADSKRISAKLLSFMLVAVVAVQTVFFSGQLVIGNRSQQHNVFSAYREIAAELNEQDEGYFRVKDYSEDVSANAPLVGNTNAFSVFSSMIDADNFVTNQLFGYLGNGKNSYKSAHNENKSNRAEEFGDAFLGYKYFFVPSGEKAEADAKDYLTPVTVTNEQGVAVPLKRGNYYAYENTLVFPSGYRVASGEFSFVAPNEANSTYRKQNQAALYEYLRGESLKASTGKDTVTEKAVGELCEYLWDKAADVQVGAGEITARVTAEKGEYLLLNFVASQGYRVWVNGRETTLLDNDLKFLLVELDEGENVVEFRYASPYVKYIWMGVAGALFTLAAAAALVVLQRRTGFMKYAAPVIAWAGIALGIVVVAFFMLLPSAVFATKLMELAKTYCVKGWTWLKGRF